MCACGAMGCAAVELAEEIDACITGNAENPSSSVSHHCPGNAKDLSSVSCVMPMSEVPSLMSSINVADAYVHIDLDVERGYMDLPIIDTLVTFAYTPAPYIDTPSTTSVASDDDESDEVSGCGYAGHGADCVCDRPGKPCAQPTPPTLIDTPTTIPLVYFPFEQGLDSAASTEAIDWAAADLMEAIVVAKRYGEPIPDFMGFDAWLHQNIPVCINDFTATWSSACIEEMDFKIKRMHKRRGKHDARAEASWLHGTADGYKGLDCRVCGGHLPEYADLPGSTCECNALIIDTKDKELPTGIGGIDGPIGAAHMLYQQPSLGMVHIGAQEVDTRLDTDIHFETTVGGAIEFKLNDTDRVLGRVEILADDISAEVMVPDEEQAAAHASIAQRVEAPNEERVKALARRLPNIKRRAPDDHQWQHSVRMTNKDLAKVMLALCDTIERWCLKTGDKEAAKGDVQVSVQ